MRRTRFVLLIYGGTEFANKLPPRGRPGGYDLQLVVVEALFAQYRIRLDLGKKSLIKNFLKRIVVERGRIGHPFLLNLYHQLLIRERVIHKERVAVLLKREIVNHPLITNTREVFLIIIFILDIIRIRIDRVAGRVLLVFLFSNRAQAVLLRVNMGWNKRLHLEAFGRILLYRGFVS